MHGGLFAILFNTSTCMAVIARMMPKKLDIKAAQITKAIYIQTQSATEETTKDSIANIPKAEMILKQNARSSLPVVPVDGVEQVGIVASTPLPILMLTVMTMESVSARATTEGSYRSACRRLSKGSKNTNCAEYSTYNCQV